MQFRMQTFPEGKPDCDNTTDQGDCHHDRNNIDDNVAQHVCLVYACRDHVFVLPRLLVLVRLWRWHICRLPQIWLLLFSSFHGLTIFTENPVVYFLLVNDFQVNDLSELILDDHHIGWSLQIQQGKADNNLQRAERRPHLLHRFVGEDLSDERDHEARSQHATNHFSCRLQCSKLFAAPHK